MSYIIKIRRLILKTLGRKRATKIKTIIWNIISNMYTYFKSVEPPHTCRPYGVSAVIWSKNEEDWIEFSMRSVAEIVDEYVLIDASTDRTPQIAMETGRELDIPVKIVRVTTRNMAEVGNLGLKHSSYRWILKWDPDFILHEDYVIMLKKLVEELDSKSEYYLILWPHICLDGDLFHYNPKDYLHIEPWLFNYHSKLRYKMIGWLEHLDFSLFYKRLFIDKPLSFHLITVKNPVRLLYRKYWYEVRKKGILDKVDLEGYARRRIVDEYGTTNVEEAAMLYIKEILSRLARYKPHKHLLYPKLLKDYLKAHGIRLE